MKADERHKLRTNQLADWVQHAPQFLRKHARLLVTCVLLVVAVGLALWYRSYRNEAQQDKAWNELAAAVSKYDHASSSGLAGDQADAIQEFGRIATEYPKTPPVTIMALLYQGEGLLDQARRKALDVVGRGNYRNLLDEAEKALEAAVRQPYHPLFTAQARLALAGVATDQSDFSKAREILTAIKDDPKADAEMKSLAAKQIVDLAGATRITFARPTPTTSVDVPIPGRLESSQPDVLELPRPAPAPTTQKTSP